MNVMVLTQCTARKHATAMPAERLYLGEGHKRLMRGVRAAREAGHTIDVWIVSAFYGVIPGTQVIPPYDVTFGTMSLDARRGMSRKLGIAEHVMELLSVFAYDRGLICLGELYAEPIPLGRCPVSYPTIRFAAQPKLFGGRYREADASQYQTGRFGAGNISLKGEMAARVLERGVFLDEDRFLALGESGLALEAIA